MGQKALELLLRIPKKFVNVAATATAIAAFIVSLAASDTSGVAREFLIGIAALSYVASIGSVKLNAHRDSDLAEKEKNEAIGEAAELRTMLDGWLEPYAFQLLRAKTSTGGDKMEQKGFAKKVLLSVSKILEKRVHTEVRMCFFKLGCATPRTLSCDIWEGGVKPRTDFVEGTDEGDFAFRTLDFDEVTFISDDFECEKPPLWDSRRYKCYMSSPVMYGDKLLGMLTVDSANTAALSESDKPFVKAIAALLAVTSKI